MDILLLFRYLDSSYLNVNVEVNYIRVDVKGKPFQIALSEEVTPSAATVQRSQITGHLVVKAPKLKWQESLAVIDPIGNWKFFFYRSIMNSLSPVA